MISYNDARNRKLDDIYALQNQVNSKDSNKAFPFFIRFLLYVITNWWYMSPNRCWHWNYCNNFFNCFYTISVVKNMSDKYAKMFRLKCLEYNVRISCRIIHKDYWLWDITVVRWIVLQQNIWWNRNSNILTNFDIAKHTYSLYIYCPKQSFR